MEPKFRHPDPVKNSWGNQSEKAVACPMRLFELRSLPAESDEQFRLCRDHQSQPNQTRRCQLAVFASSSSAESKHRNCANCEDCSPQLRKTGRFRESIHH